MMTEMSFGIARAVADLGEGSILATVEIAAPPARVFKALASKEVVEWWVRPGVFDTREWSGDLRVGGRWQASGVGGGRPYTLEGEYLEIDPPRKLVHTWHLTGSPAPRSTVVYVLEPTPTGTRLTLHHTGMASRDASMRNAMGWETSFARLADYVRERATAA